MNKFLKALVCIDLWVAIVSATVFVSLFFIRQYVYLNEILIFIVVFLSFNVVYCIPFGVNFIKVNRSNAGRQKINY